MSEAGGGRLQGALELKTNSATRVGARCPTTRLPSRPLQISHAFVPGSPLPPSLLSPGLVLPALFPPAHSRRSVNARRSQHYCSAGLHQGLVV